MQMDQARFFQSTPLIPALQNFLAYFCRYRAVINKALVVPVHCQRDKALAAPVHFRPCTVSAALEQNLQPS